MGPRLQTLHYSMLKCLETQKLTVLEGQHLKGTVETTDNDGKSQEEGVGLDQHALDLIELSTSTAHHS